jgi:hypothetical protein
MITQKSIDGDGGHRKRYYLLLPQLRSATRPPERYWQQGRISGQMAVLCLILIVLCAWGIWEVLR